MASPSPSPLRAAPLQPSDWIHAGNSRLAQDGIEAVRVEVLARDLNVSKGSFYWHFRDRDELLMRMLGAWEESETTWLASEESTAGDQPNPAARWARFVERSADPNRIREEIGVRAWARRDERVGARVSEIERRKATVVASVLEEIGFTREAAVSWAEMVALVYLGWLDRTARDADFRASGRGLGEFLSDLVLAAAKTSAANR
jgi:AcrR family transcriptional regulator